MEPTAAVFFFVHPGRWAAAVVPLGTRGPLGGAERVPLPPRRKGFLFGKRFAQEPPQGGRGTASKNVAATQNRFMTVSFWFVEFRYLGFSSRKHTSAARGLGTSHRSWWVGGPAACFFIFILHDPFYDDTAVLS